MTARARVRNQKRGEDHHRTRYCDAIVARARALYVPGRVGYKTVSDRLGVPQRTVMDWLRGLTRTGRCSRADKLMDRFLRAKPARVRP